MIGKLNQRATIQAKTSSSDGGGGFDGGWSDVATVWVFVESVGARNVFGPDRNEQRNRYRLTLRRNTLIEAGHRILIGGRSMTIENVIDEGANAPFMTLLCEEMS